MKISSLITLLSFVLIALATKPLLVRSAPLIDIQGNEVESTLDYYIMPSIWGPPGGGLYLVPGRNRSCPLDVGRERFDLQRGLRIRFSPVDSSTTVDESTDLNIRFVKADTSCNDATVWKVDNYDDSRGKWYITTGGEEGNPGARTLLNWFKFEKTESRPGTYKIVHCPSVCDSCVNLCNDVGVDLEDNDRRLVLKTDLNPLFDRVTLVRATEGSMYC
ncbi:Trypsin inhibitor [Melia azedarach]|uniref:Trypsin inhibitor n=1 Tax=Melia azedarach TaxID=155640 RepID=A0ACC1XQC8_MELAZ|nr:Trypsin inhibitor [Melia azedarach]